MVRGSLHIRQRTPAELAAACMAGDLSALEALYRAHATNVRDTAYRLLLSIDDAEDVVQDVFVGLPRSLRGLRDPDRLSSWLRRVAATHALMAMRRARRLHHTTLDVTPRDPSHALDARLDLTRALATLPERQRTVLVLKDVEGWSHEEIGAALAISPNASMALMSRARRALLPLLKD